uniref:Uncharacterized protein n=1 Tax=Panagrolaimus superbus TaxID=310955 RepID=A0A914YH93_9BILA
MLPNMHFCLQCENVAEKNKVLELFQQFLYQESEEDKFVKEFLNYEFANTENLNDIEEEFDDDHSLFPKTGGIVFPLSSGKKRFTYHVGCGLTTEVLESWYRKNLHQNPPPHWRDHPKAKIVRQGYIEGDPIEESRGEVKYKYKKQREYDPFPLCRPPDYVPRRYEDYI